MTNGIALGIVLALGALFALDAFVLHWHLPVLAGRQIVRLVDWVEFWR